jgi:hypothetical protein
MRKCPIRQVKAAVRASKHLCSCCTGSTTVRLADEDDSLASSEWLAAAVIGSTESHRAAAHNDFVRLAAPLTAAGINRRVIELLAGACHNMS